MLIGYMLLILTLLCESASVVFMKLSNGFENKIQLVFALLFYILSFGFTTFALKYFPMGWTNAIWAGSSTIIVALVGFYYFNEKITFHQTLFFSLIIIGLVGLNFYKEIKI